MKSDKITTKAIKGIIPKVEEKLVAKDINLKKDKQLSNETFHIYEDTFKCIDDIDNKKFYIKGIVKKNIFLFRFLIQTLKCMTGMELYIQKIILVRIFIILEFFILFQKVPAVSKFII